MSTGEDELVFESFLRKRGKRMKLKWMTYWFRLQNSVLCFYSTKHRNSLQLKGQYYICMLHTVREVQKVESKRYAFEIGMKDGKRKLLAADTAELRQTWMDLLLNAMQSPGYVHPDPACSWQEEAELRSSERDSTRSSSGSEGERGRQDSRPSSELWDTPTLTPGPHTADPPTSEASNPSQPAEESFDSGLWRYSMEPEEEEDKEAQESYYDVLPSRTSHYCPLEEEGIYDVPLCNMRAIEGRHPGYREMTESIYDVPSSLLRRLSEQNIGEYSEGVWMPENGSNPDTEEIRSQCGSVGWTAL